MSSDKRENANIDSARDAELIDSIKNSYAPDRLAPKRRVALEEDLWRRVGARRRQRMLIPGLVTAATAVAVVWQLAAPSGQTADVDSPLVASVQIAKTSVPVAVIAAAGEATVVDSLQARPSVEAADDSWESELLDPGTILNSEAGKGADHGELPPVYEAIVLAFLDY
ncbi:MAG: hypothetical protein ACI8TX_000202 [Hyphomicrobiaceae bacterium]|jgi:hypothetical protein